MGEAGWVPFLVSPMGRARWLEGSGTSFGWKGGAKEMESGLLGSRRGAHERPPRWMPVRFGRTFGHAGREKKRKGPSGPLLLFFLLFSAARRPSRRGRGEEKFHRARRRIPAGEMRRWEGAPRGGGAPGTTSGTVLCASISRVLTLPHPSSIPLPPYFFFSQAIQSVHK